MSLLIVGVFVWSLTHLFPAVLPGPRQNLERKLGEKAAVGAEARANASEGVGEVPVDCRTFDGAEARRELGEQPLEALSLRCAHLWALWGNHSPSRGLRSA